MSSYSFKKASVEFVNEDKFEIADADAKKNFFHRTAVSDRKYTARPIPGSKIEVILHGILYKADGKDDFGYCNLKFEFENDGALDFVFDLRTYYGYTKK